MFTQTDTIRQLAKEVDDICQELQEIKFPSVAFDELVNALMSAYELQSCLLNALRILEG
jgi:hypothetical protein